MSAGGETVAARVPAEFRAELDERAAALRAAGVHYPDGRPADLSYVIRVGLRAYLDADPSEQLSAEVADALALDGFRRVRSVQGDRRAQAEQGRDAGIASADWNADPLWKADALDAIIKMAGIADDFTIDEVWDATGLRRPLEARAMGPVVRQAAARGVIARTTRTRPSNSSHRSPMPVWRSLLRAASVSVSTEEENPDG